MRVVREKAWHVIKTSAFHSQRFPTTWFPPQLLYSLGTAGTDVYLLIICIAGHRVNHIVSRIPCSSADSKGKSQWKVLWVNFKKSDKRSSSRVSTRATTVYIGYKRPILLADLARAAPV